MAGPDQENPRAYPDRPYVGVGIVVFRGDQVLLAQRGKPPNMYSWSIPGGAQELGETVHEAAVRELKEETCLEADILGLVDVVDSIRRDDDGNIAFHFTLIDLVAEWRAGEAVAGDDVPELEWVKLEDVGAYGLRDSTLRIIRMAEQMRRENAFGNRRAAGSL